MSVEIHERPSKDGAAAYQVMRVDTVEEALEAIVPRIRTKSREFYRGEIRADLEQYGRAVVDQHAGGGFLWVIGFRRGAQQ